MNLRHILAAGALAAVSVTSFAQAPVTPPVTPTPPPVTDPAPPPGMNNREANQHDRIAAGKQSGEITKREARRLHAEQKAVDRAQNKAAADGSVSTQERQRIRRLQSRADRDIHRQKHDGGTRPDKPVNTPATPVAPSAK